MVYRVITGSGQRHNNFCDFDLSLSLLPPVTIVPVVHDLLPLRPDGFDMEYICREDRRVCLEFLRVCVRGAVNIPFTVLLFEAICDDGGVMPRKKLRIPRAGLL